MSYLFLILAFSFNALANILLKVGSRSGFVLEPATPAALLMNNWLFIAGCGVFAVNVLFYFLALRSFPISVAYPVMVVMSFIIINGYALTMLGETITMLQLVGYALIIVGLLLVVA